MRAIVPAAPVASRRVVLHVSAPGLFAALDAASLSGLSDADSCELIVTGSSDVSDGPVVETASREASRRGVRPGMPIAQAAARCPGAVIVEASARSLVRGVSVLHVMLDRFSPRIEPVNADEAFIELRGVHGPAAAYRAALKIRATIGRRFPVVRAIGIGPGKLIARAASVLARAGEIVELDERTFRDRFWDRNVSDLPGVGARMADRLNDLGIFSIGQLARTRREDLERVFGIVGKEIRARARGCHRDPVIPFPVESLDSSEPAHPLARAVGDDRTADRATRIVSAAGDCAESHGSRPGPQDARTDGRPGRKTYRGRRVIVKLCSGHANPITRGLSIVGVGRRIAKAAPRRRAAAVSAAASAVVSRVDCV